MRLDIEMVVRGLVTSRERAKKLIENGKVIINGKISKKASQSVEPQDEIVVTEDFSYVSRGGEKLKAALDAFSINVANLTVLDVGASTGGFVDCLLQNGAKRVYAVDVGKDQLAMKLRSNPKVVCIENTDIREIKTLPEPIDLVTIDVSFISLTKIVPAIRNFFKGLERKLIVLIKPQFECGPGVVNRRGIITSSEIREKILKKLLDWFQNDGWQLVGYIQSPILGGDGNIEFLAYFR